MRYSRKIRLANRPEEQIIKRFQEIINFLELGLVQEAICTAVDAIKNLNTDSVDPEKAFYELRIAQLEKALMQCLAIHRE